MQNFTEPLDMVRNNINSEIAIRLRNGTRVNGILTAYDEHMNLMLRDVRIERKIRENNKETNIKVKENDSKKGYGEVEEKKLMYLRGDTVLCLGKV